MSILVFINWFRNYDQSSCQSDIFTPPCKNRSWFIFWQISLAALPWLMLTSLFFSKLWWSKNLHLILDRAAVYDDDGGSKERWRRIPHLKHFSPIVDQSWCDVKIVLNEHALKKVQFPLEPNFVSIFWTPISLAHPVFESYFLQHCASQGPS